MGCSPSAMLSLASQGSTTPTVNRVASSGSFAGPTTPGFKGAELKALFGTDFQPHPDLIRAIETKQCIAFVGAGFTAPITQLTWKSLLIRMLQESTDFFRANGLEGRYEELLERLKPERPSAEDYALVAQEIQDMLGEDKFEEFIQANCKLLDSTILTPEMVHRIRCMSRIPFKAIITTNYNSCFSGLEKNIEPALLNGSINPCSLWESILRGSSRDDSLLDDQEEVMHGAQTLDGEQDSEENSVDSYAEVKESMTLKAALAKYQFRCPILKIHGCVDPFKSLSRYPNSIILSRRGYKRLQYETPGFKMFLTSAMATNTMLYIGFSFTDDYLNEFRAEVLKMLRPSPRLHVQYKMILECLKRINKANLLSHFYDKGLHDDYLLDLKFSSSQSDALKARIKEIEGIQDSDVDEIELFVKARVVATSRRSNDFLELDKAPPIAYAIIDSKSQQQINYFRRHEGVQIMTWDTNGWFGGLDCYLDGILRQTSRPFLWGNFLTKSVLENNRVIITWDLGTVMQKKVAWWLQQCLEFYRNSSRHQKSLYEEAAKRKEKLSPYADDCFSTDSRASRGSSCDFKRAKSCSSGIIVPVTSVETLEQALEIYKDRVACVICPFGLSDGFLTAVKDEAEKQGTKTLNIYDASAPGRYQHFMSADHIVRLVQKIMAGRPPQFQCPFIVYANHQRDRVADSWRQECAMRCGAFGFACRTDELFEIIKRVTDVYLPCEQTQSP